MKIILFTGDAAFEYVECELESSFVELTFVGRFRSAVFGISPKKRIVTTLGYIIETEVDDKPPTTSVFPPKAFNRFKDVDPLKTTYGSLLPNRSTDHLPEGSI